MQESTPPTLEELQKLHRDLTEKVLVRAMSDPRWKQQLLDDPEAATAEFPEAQRFREMYESPTPEAIPISQEEYRQLQRSLWEKMIDKAQEDPQWRQQLLEDHKAAMKAANFPEIEMLSEMRSQTAEISGQRLQDQVYEDQVYFNWWGNWRVVELSPYDLKVLGRGSSAIGGITY